MSRCGAVCDFFSVLYSLPKQVWVVCVLHTLDAFAEFALSTNLTIFLTKQFELSDVQAGFYYGLWGMLRVVLGIPTGYLIDRFGIKKSMLIGAVFNCFGRAAFALSSNMYVSLGSLYVLTTIGSGFFGSVLHVAVNKYTSNSSRHASVAFAMLYTFANIGAIVAMLGTDVALTIGADNGYRMLFSCGAAVTVLTLLISALFRDVQFREDKFDEEELPRSELMRIFCEPQFWRIFTINAFCIGVRSMFRYWETLLPLWLTRVYPGIHYGTILALNPILIIPSTPIMGTLTQNISRVYWVLVVGALFSALSAAVPWLWTSSTILPIVVSICVFTIPGEAVYSPKLGQITLERSPSGKKGLYSGLIQLPSFAANAVAGPFSGWLLQRYCPADSSNSSSFDLTDTAQQCSKVWGWILLTSISSAVLLALFYRPLNPRIKIKRIQFHDIDEANLNHVELTDSDESAS
jgi:MFS family permease